MGSAGGGYTRQALAMGYNDKQADLFGAIMGSMEGATEAVGGALTANVGKKFASKGLQAGLGALGLDVTENFLEEAIMEPIQELTKQSIGKNGDWKDITKRMLRSGLDGALTSIIMGGVSAGVGSAVKVATKAQNNEVISQEEIKQALQDINKSEEVDIEKLLVDSFNFQAQDLMQVTEAQQRKDDRLEKVAQDISQDEGLKIKYVNLDDDRISQIENSELSENQINKLLDISNKYDLSQKDIQDLIDNTKNGKYEQNQATTTPNNEILNQEQQTIQEEGKKAQNQTSEQQEENKQKVIEKEENNKEKQLKIIQESNPMQDDYHTGIRNVEDIKTFAEAIEDDESFVWGDYSKEDAQRDLEKGTVTVYSSKPIEDGVFVSTSKNQAQDYAGNEQIYSQEIPINDVAWINGDEGQYAKVDTEQQPVEQTVKEEKIKLPETTSSKVTTYKKEYEILQKAKNDIENLDIFSLSSEDWIQKSNELDKINNEQSVLKSKIDELENIPDTSNNIVKNRKTKKAFPQKVKETNAKFQKAFINKFYTIDKIAKDTKNKNLSIALDNWIGATQQVETAIDGNTKFGTGQTDLNGNVTGESITQILKEVYKKKDVISLTDYMQNKLNIERSKQNKSNLDVSVEQSKAIIEKYDKQKPYLKEVSEKLYKFYDNVLQNCVDAGLGTKELKDLVRQMYPSYMPIYKNISELTSFIDNGEINNRMIKKAVGGQTDILAIDVASAEYAMGMNRKIQLNNLLVELRNSLEKNNQLEDYVNTELQANAEDFVSDKQSKGNEMLSETVDGDKIATCYINGEAHQFKISDEIYNLLKPQTIKETKFAEDVITSANQLFRKAVTTYNPAFTLRNMIKDFSNGMYNTKYTAPIYLKNYLKGIKEIITNGEYAQLYRNAGLQGNSKYSKNSGILTRANKGIISKYNPISLGNTAIEFVNTNIETMGRMSEFISAIESGKSLDEARYDASEVTLNFKRGGETSKAITKWGGTFFNSSVLAVDKTIKNITGKNGVKGVANFVTMGLISGVGLSLLNHLTYGDDDDYEELPDYIKDGYWLIKKNDGSGTFYRIPKDQLTTAIGSSARRIYQMAKGEENIDELQDMFKAIFDNIGIDNPVTSNLYSGLIDASKGRTWYDGDLISDYQKTLEPELQYDYRTNEISKWTANQIAKLPESAKSTLKGMPVVNKAYDILSSPKKSDYVLQQYTGGIGKMLLPKVTPYAEQSYVEKELTTNSVLKSKYPSMVYDEFDKAEKELNSYGTGEDRYKYLDEGKKQLSEFYTQIREIENDDNLTDNQKRQQEFEVRKELNKTAREIINNLKTMQKGQNTSKIGDKTYYKEESTGKWKEAKNTNGISAESYSNYANAIKEATDKKREETGKDTSELNDIEKINILKSGNYSKKEKDLLYTQVLKDKEDEIYNNLKLLNGNSLSFIDSYFDYKTRDFSNERKPDGTAKGKSIPKTGQKKLENFMKENDNQLTYMQKLYLIGINNTTPNATERKNLINYIDSLNITESQKNTIKKKLSFATEMEDGSVRIKYN